MNGTVLSIERSCVRPVATNSVSAGISVKDGAGGVDEISADRRCVGIASEACGRACVCESPGYYGLTSR